MIGPALRHLLWLRLRGGFRARLRESLSVRGMSLLALTGLLAWLLSGSPALSDLSEFSIRVGDPVRMRQQFIEYLPAGLLIFSMVTAFTASGSPIHFSPAEANFLFSAPLRRQSLLLYKFVVFAFGAVVSAIFVALIFSVGDPAAAFIGALLILMFTQLFSIGVGMLIELIRASRFAVFHRSLAIGLPITGGLSLLVWMMLGSGDWMALWALFRNSLVSDLLLTPFIPFMKVFISTTLSAEMIGWACVAFTLIGVLLFTVIKLDELTYEATLLRDESPRQGVRDALGFTLLSRSNSETVKSRHIDMRLGGVATIAWRQWTIASRGASRTILTYVVVMALAGVTVAGFSFISPQAKVVMLVVISLFMLPRSMIFDFRSDLHLIESLRQLPIPPWRICAGQLLIPIMLTTLLEWVLLLAALPSLSELAREIAILTGLFLLPLNALIYSIENLLILLFPVPPMPVGRMDFHFIGRNMVDMAVKVILVLFVAVLAASLALLAFDASGHWFGLAVLIAWTVVAASALACLPIMAWALRRFDVNYRAFE